ncbi:CinA family protein, partial [Dehalococcoidia bacterium]|nr:CinA family protein [Dehalococcoidia bacterium]
GGHVTDAFTDVDQASNYFSGSFIASTVDSVISIGVPQALIEQHGYVSQEVALAMADTVRKNLSAEVGIGIVGSLGPDPVDDTPAGTVFIAISSDADQKVRQATFPQNRQDLRWRVRNAVLFDLLTWLHTNSE